MLCGKFCFFFGQGAMISSRNRVSTSRMQVNCKKCDEISGSIEPRGVDSETNEITISKY